jgi:hypothetical protein
MDAGRHSKKVIALRFLDYLEFRTTEVITEIYDELEDHGHLLVREYPGKVFLPYCPPGMVNLGDYLLGEDLEDRKLPYGLQLLDA